MRKYSIYLWFGIPVPAEERMKMIKAAGFDGVFLWWSDELFDLDGDRFAHPAMARKSGLFVENIHTPIMPKNTLWEDGIEGDAHEKILFDCIDDCKKYEIPTAVVHITYGKDPTPYNQIGLDRIKRLVDSAEKKNINIALENIERPDYLEFVFNNIQSKRLGFCYDSGHENCYTKGTRLLSQYGSKLMALHLHDNDELHDQHNIPGEGSIDWCAVKEDLDKTNYSGSIALEILNKYSKFSGKDNAEAFLKRAFDEAKRIFE